MLRDTAEETGEPLEGIGIGCTGPVDPFTGVLEDIAFLPDWRGFHLAEELRNAFDVPVFLENDADAAALGEYTWGAGKGSNHFIYITISTGIGGGMVIDGHLYRGADGAHPEVGHIVIDPSGPRCFCGAHGCWESLASGPALAERAGLPTALAVCKAAENGDPAAQAAINLEAYYLGIGFANLITLFVPDVIAFGGGVMNSRHLFWDRTYQTIQENCGMVPFKKTRVVPAQLGKKCCVGGGCRGLEKKDLSFMTDQLKAVPYINDILRQPEAFTEHALRVGEARHAGSCSTGFRFSLRETKSNNSNRHGLLFPCASSPIAGIAATINPSHIIGNLRIDTLLPCSAL